MIRVLIVDDAHVIRDSLRKKVEDMDVSIVVAGDESNGQKALEWLDVHYADLCITDVRMPVMNGLELVRTINERYPWMVSLIISSYSDFEYAKESIQLEAVDYMLKPVEKEVLKISLDKCKERLEALRHKDAMALFIKKLPHHREKIDQWLDHIRMQRMDTMPLLIVDTLELLEEWIEGRYHLLNSLTMIWLSTLIEELHKDRVELQLHEGKDLELGEKTIPLSKLRNYFRLCSVRRLEEGAHQLLAVVRDTKDPKSSRMIQQVVRYIREHSKEKINLQELADQAGFSRSYLIAQFKQVTNMTIWNFIISERMQKARDLLLKTNLKNYEIADRIGYDDPIHFAKLFKKHFGRTPSEYKKRME